MDIIVIGAGVGGLAVAGVLLAAGHRVRVHEQAPGRRPSGAALTIFSNGTAVLH
jgi:FAD-dependent urate hydroxylase